MDPAVKAEFLALESDSEKAKFLLERGLEAVPVDTINDSETGMRARACGVLLPTRARRTESEAIAAGIAWLEKMRDSDNVWDFYHKTINNDENTEL